jgi:transposase
MIGDSKETTMNVRYRITLTDEERDQLQSFAQAGKGAFRRLKRAQILLASEAGSTDAMIAQNISVGTSTVFRTKRRFVEEGLEAALSELPRPGADRKLAEKEEALLIATACSAPPTGRARWTLELLAGEMVRLTKHRSISSETVRRRLRRTS